jgi:hypothetical protein
VRCWCFKTYTAGVWNLKRIEINFNYKTVYNVMASEGRSNTGGAKKSIHILRNVIYVVYTFFLAPSVYNRKRKMTYNNVVHVEVMFALLGVKFCM